MRIECRSSSVDCLRPLGDSGSRRSSSTARVTTPEGAAGFYHAHLHLVPLPGRLAPGDLFPAHLSAAADLRTALRALRECSQYLLAGNEHGVVYARVADLATQPGSQYFRRLLTERFGSTRPWDWRAFKTPEPRCPHHARRVRELQWRSAVTGSRAPETRAAS